MSQKNIQINKIIKMLKNLGITYFLKPRFEDGDVILRGDIHAVTHQAASHLLR